MEGKDQMETRQRKVVQIEQEVPDQKTGVVKRTVAGQMETLAVKRMEPGQM